jgi:WD40 repeat protein
MTGGVAADGRVLVDDGGDGGLRGKNFSRRQAAEMRKREGDVHAMALTSSAVEFPGRRLKPAGDWKQLGGDIEGEAFMEQSGWTVAVSADGKRVAVVASVDVSQTSGLVRIFQLEKDTWIKVGEDIIDEHGASSNLEVAMSADGSRIAIGAPSYIRYDSTFPGHVRIYDLDLAETTWTKVGEIGGEALMAAYCYVAMSADGSRVAIGVPLTHGVYGVPGRVSIYDLSKTPFTQVGDTIIGESEYEAFGFVAMSEDGSRVAIGAAGHDGSNGADSGHVRIYDVDVDLDGTTSTWTKVGEDIIGDSPGDRLGTSVAMSADGGRVVIGAHVNYGNLQKLAYVRIYDLSETPFTQVGEDIDGEVLGDYVGVSVAMSADGSRVAIGAENNLGINGGYSGHVRIFDEMGMTWTQFGQDLDGEAPCDWSGKSVAMSADGSRVVVGAIGNDNNGNDWAGHVRVYKVCGLQYPLYSRLVR